MRSRDTRIHRVGPDLERLIQVPELANPDPGKGQWMRVGRYPRPRYGLIRSVQVGKDPENSLKRPILA